MSHKHSELYIVVAVVAFLLAHPTLFDVTLRVRPTTRACEWALFIDSM